ncbi:MAG: hypothetical protein ACLFQK_05260 [Fibrobacterota bacterium]
MAIEYPNNCGSGDDMKVDGMVGIGITDPVGHLHIEDNSIDTNSVYYGVRNVHTKIAGSTNTGDDIYGLFNNLNYNHCQHRFNISQKRRKKVSHYS